MNIAYGICGIGNGHSFRQLPLVETLAIEGHRLMLFGYGASLELFSQRFAAHENVSIAEVAVPYYVGSLAGLDFGASATVAERQPVDTTAVNCRAMAAADAFFGKPDVAISDYEPVVAQYAYAHDAPLITIDQQSKYLMGDFPAELAGCSYADEVTRLRMFFPKAAGRIACSFFDVQPRVDGETVSICPPPLRPALTRVRREAVRDPKRSLVYISGQEGLRQPLAELTDALGAAAGMSFELFTPDSRLSEATQLPGNVTVYSHGDPYFERSLTAVGSIIATAGHGLLSEAMHLEVPVLALPLRLYEQQMNAKVIADSGFGLQADHLDAAVLKAFIRQLPEFQRAITADRTVLVRGNGLQALREAIRPFIP